MKPEINYRATTTKKRNKKQNEKNTNRWRLNNIPLRKEWVNKKTTEDIRKYCKTKENGKTTFQDIWAAAKAVLRGKFYGNIDLSKEKKNSKKKQPDLPSIGIRKNKQTNKKNKQKQRQEKEGHHKDQRINK